MRELKFRAYKKATMYRQAKMFDVGVLELDDLKARDYYNFYDNYAGTTANFDEDEQDIIMQFTGLTDKNGREIYEGDIMKVEDKNGNESISFIVWGLDDWRFNSYMLNGMSLFDNVDKLSNKSIAEIIGNIHENPELLK